jgi:hypothetical protein
MGTKRNIHTNTHADAHSLEKAVTKELAVFWGQFKVFCLEGDFADQWKPSLDVNVQHL